MDQLVCWKSAKVNKKELVLLHASNEILAFTGTLTVIKLEMHYQHRLRERYMVGKMLLVGSGGTQDDGLTGVSSERFLLMLS